MCPDDKLLSAFYDGEVSSPWKEEIEEHIQVCDDCHSILKEFEQQSAQLHSEGEPALTSSFEDIQKLIRHKENIDGIHFLPAFKNPVFPIAAAAAAILAFFFGLSMAGSPGPNASYMDLPLAISEGWSVPPGDMMIPGEDIEAMLSLINQSESSLFSQEASLNLPGDLSLALYGDSQLVRSASFTGGSSR
ncbi:anti-sigma factor [Oceanispirochaeta sp.]|jgi:hypothetical protein|uniref:anti-sigma factor family protein n=1 Tax=Oceanispirochaeta sp. TaxID=2035350 RepID=UPI0026334D8E|nr:zf-HC2 domain-containing protein [Oceanispirochaeta sp.]MDA3956847.1 zf-HC2 domain-containing protein [Oceanispirochaeta sp.]